MKWTKSGIVKYEEAKEYIDTLLIPLAPFQLNENRASKVAADSEILEILSREIEKDLSGRLFKLPLYHYLQGDSFDQEINRLKQWDNSYTDLPFIHKFYLTFDVSWKKYEDDLPGTLIWLPSFHSLDIQSVEFQNVLIENAKEITALMQTFW